MRTFFLLAVMGMCGGSAAAETPRRGEHLTISVSNSSAPPVALVKANVEFKDPAELNSFSFHFDVPFNARARMTSVETIWGEKIGAADLNFTYVVVARDITGGTALMLIYRNPRTGVLSADADSSVFLKRGVGGDIALSAETASRVLPCRTVVELGLRSPDPGNGGESKDVITVSSAAIRNLLTKMAPLAEEFRCGILRSQDHFIFPGRSTLPAIINNADGCFVNATVNRSGRASRATIELFDPNNTNILERCRYSALSTEYRHSMSDELPRSVQFEMGFENVGDDRVTITPNGSDGTHIYSFNAMNVGNGTAKSRLVVDGNGVLLAEDSVKGIYGKYPCAARTMYDRASYQLCKDSPVTAGTPADFAVVVKKRFDNSPMRILEIYRAGKRISSAVPTSDVRQDVSKVSLSPEDKAVAACLNP